MKFDENDKKAYNFFNWQTNIYYKSKNLQAPAVLIPKRVLQEIEAKQASMRQTTQLTEMPSAEPSQASSLELSANLETSKTTERRYEKVERKKEERKDERAGYEVPGMKGPMVFENYYPESVLDSGKDKDNKDDTNKKEKKKEDEKPIYERTLREW
jgi:hypothetical protein